MVTRKEVADRAGVSVAVVSYVLNEKNNVREATKLKVLQAVQDLGYQPNLTARSLKTKRSQQLAVLVNDLTNPFEASILHGLETAARAAGYFVFFQTYRQEQEEELKMLFMGRVDGLILLGQSLKDTTVAHFRRLNVPMLSITKPIWDRKEIPCIDFNWVSEMRKIIRHLKGNEHRNIGFMTNGMLSSHHTQRLQGFLQALQFENGSFSQQNVLYGGGTFEGAYEAMRARIAQGLVFTAIICANDLMAAGTIAACRDEGINVPKQLAVAGCENILLSNQTNPPLTTIHFPRENLGTLVMDMLLQMIDGQKASPRFLEGELILRESSAGRDTR
jgi:DNA-binding LacI/PurR family transcriptional regulator